MTLFNFVWLIVSGALFGIAMLNAIRIAMAPVADNSSQLLGWMAAMMVSGLLFGAALDTVLP